jgi:serine/threonine protein kinase
MSTNAPRLTRGDRLKHFQIREMLGRGESAEVYRAYHPNLKRDVAIKLFHPDITRTESLTPLFLHQARDIIALRHPNIVRVLEAGDEGGSYYLVMELIDGTNLRDEMSMHPRGYDREDAVKLFSQIASAVSYAHDQGIVHGNIKPDNVLLGLRLRPILTDFNIPVFREHPSGRGGAATPIYLAPEQARQNLVTEQSDIYSLGIMLYELATGDVPFKGGSFKAIIEQHHSQVPKPPSQVRVGLDPRIDKTILTALAKDPAQRFTSVREMLHSLESTSDDNPFETVSLTRDDLAEMSRKRQSEIRHFEQSRTGPEGDNQNSSVVDPRRRMIVGAVVVAAIVLIIAFVLALALL